MPARARPAAPPPSPRAAAPGPKVVRVAAPSYVQPGERVLHRTGRHPLSIVDVLLSLGFLALLLGAAAVAVSLAGVPNPAAILLHLLIGALGIVLVAAAVASWWRITTSDYLLTSERVYKSFGKLRYFLLQTTYDKVTDIHVYQSFFGRWKGFGSVTVQTAGTGITLEGVRDPFGVLRTLEAARVGFVRALVGEQRAPARAVVAPSVAGEPLYVAGAKGSALWTGRPSWVAFWLQAVPFFLFILVFAFGSGAALLFEEAPGALPLVAVGILLVGGLVFLALVVRQRTTRYEVLPRGVVSSVGWLSRRRVETTYEKVTDVTTTQGILGRLLDYGSISINTAGSNAAPVVFQNVPAPEQVKATIDQARGRRRAA